MTGDDQSFAEIRASETRDCPQCGYTILNPLVDRCPRCFAAVARIEVECGSCAHQGNCEIAALKTTGARRRETR